MKKLGLLICCFAAFIFFVVATANAQEAAVNAQDVTVNAQEVPENEMIDYSYGEVVSIAGQQLVISDYNFETEEAFEITFTINDETKFENLNSKEDIAVGDYLEVIYIKNGDEKIARIITKDIPSKDETSDSEEGADTETGTAPVVPQ